MGVERGGPRAALGFDLESLAGRAALRRNTQPFWVWVGGRQTGVFLVSLRVVVFPPLGSDFLLVSFFKSVFAVTLLVNSIRGNQASAAQSSCQIRC